MGERIRAFPWEAPRWGPSILAASLKDDRPHPADHGPSHDDHVGSRPHLPVQRHVFPSLGPEKHPAILGAPGGVPGRKSGRLSGGKSSMCCVATARCGPKTNACRSFASANCRRCIGPTAIAPSTNPRPRTAWAACWSPAQRRPPRSCPSGNSPPSSNGSFSCSIRRRPSSPLLRGPNHLIELANPGLPGTGRASIGGRPHGGRGAPGSGRAGIPGPARRGPTGPARRAWATGSKFIAQGSRRADRSTSATSTSSINRSPTATAASPASSCKVLDVTARATTDRALSMNRARLDYATRLSGVGFWSCDLPFDQLEWDDRVKEHFFFAPTDRVTIDDFYARIHEEDRTATRDAIEASIRSHTPYSIVYRTVDANNRRDQTYPRPRRHRLRPRRHADALRRRDGRCLGADARSAAACRAQSPAARTGPTEGRIHRDVVHDCATRSPHRGRPRSSRHRRPRPRNCSARRIIERQVTHMALLLDDLLDIARITQGKLDNSGKSGWG